MSNIYTIKVTPAHNDSLGKTIRQEAQRTLSIHSIKHIKTAKIYHIQGITSTEAYTLAKKLFTDPINEKYTINPFTLQTSHCIEILYKPGIMNPEIASIKKAAQDLGINLQAITISKEFSFIGKANNKEINFLISRLLMNKNIEHISVQKQTLLLFENNIPSINVIPLLKATQDDLMQLSTDKLFLNLEEMSTIQKYFQKLSRDPTDIELEIIAARWSEHCGHKTFKSKIIVNGIEKEPLFDRIKKTAQKYFKDLVISAFDDNSGVMRFYDGLAICGKVETHNSPSAIEPYGGAMTGSGGVFRDIMGTGQGAQLIISTDMFCSAPPNLDTSFLPSGTLHPDYLLRRVVHGVRDYGNRMGIPTANGSLHFHKDFCAKPTIIVGAYGIMPELYAQKGTPQINDLVVVIGGKTGRDGLHGATFSSGEMTERTAQVNSNAVQIGNAIEEKRMFDAILEARDLNLIRALTDCGAAGFSSAIGEMGENIGVTIDISKVPLKYSGLSPWEIFLSESQERMIAAISPDNINKFKKVCKKFNVEATVLGTFDGHHTLTVKYEKQTIVKLDYNFLIKGLPQRTMLANWKQKTVSETHPSVPHNQQEWIKRIKAVLSHGNVCSKEPIVRQYDHGVQGRIIVPPFGGKNQDGPNDALVVRPIFNKPYGVVQSHGINPILNSIDPYEGSIWAITEALANYVAVGGNIQEATLINNYIWPFPDEKVMGSLDRSVDAVIDMMNIFRIPVISGKDSLSSTYKGKNGHIITIPPVLCISVFGRIPDVDKTITSDIKKPGSTLVLIGTLSNGMAGSTYYDITQTSSNYLPKIDSHTLPKIFTTLHTAIIHNKILSCHDISEGGILSTISEMCFGGNCGAKIQLNDLLPSSIDTFLFNETAGCFVVEIENEKIAQEVFHTIPYRILGKTTSCKKLNVSIITQTVPITLFTVSIDALKKAWQVPMQRIFQ